jgi:hypothetical protein
LGIAKSLEGSFTEVRLIHRAKALSPMYLTVSGMVIDVSDAQYLNVNPPIDSTPLGISTDLRLVQPEKA